MQSRSPVARIPGRPRVRDPDVRRSPDAIEWPLLLARARRVAEQLLGATRRRPPGRSGAARTARTLDSSVAGAAADGDGLASADALRRRRPARGAGRRRRCTTTRAQVLADEVVGVACGRGVPACLQHAEQRRGDEDRRVGAGEHADRAGRGRTPAASPGRAARRRRRAARTPAGAPRATCSATASAPGSSRR